MKHVKDFKDEFLDILVILMHLRRIRTDMISACILLSKLTKLEFTIASLFYTIVQVSVSFSGASAEDCCKFKVVNDITYQLVENTNVVGDPKCNNNCIYQIHSPQNESSQKLFCFGPGHFIPKCHDGGNVMF